MLEQMNKWAIKAKIDFKLLSLKLNQADLSYYFQNGAIFKK
jgi:hypothetical protein